MYCYDLEFMSSNPGQVELGVRSTYVLSYIWEITAGWVVRAGVSKLMYCYDLEVMGLNPSRVKFGVYSTCVLSYT